MDLCNIFCNMLNVKPNEPFSINGEWYLILPDGNFQRRKFSAWSRVDDVNEIAAIFNNAYKVSHIPDFSEDDKTLSSNFIKMFGRKGTSNKFISRDSSGELSIQNSSGLRIELDKNLFPSILPGMSYFLNEIA